MSALPQCPRCRDPLVGASTPRGRRARGNKPFPEGSMGYCSSCHIGLTKMNGVWAAVAVALVP